MKHACAFLVPLLGVSLFAPQISPQNLNDVEARNRALVRRYVDELYNRHEITNINQILAPGFHLKTTSQDLDLAGARKLFSQPQSAFPDWTLEISDMMVDRNTVVIRDHFSGHHEGDFMGLSPSHKRCDTTGTEAFRITEGKIDTVWVTTNQLPIMSCLGLVKVP